MPPPGISTLCEEPMAAGDQCGLTGLRAAPRPPRTARSAPPRSTWDVALAAAGEPGRTARREIVSAAARAAATPQTAPPAASRWEGPERARVGWKGRRTIAGRGRLTLAREQKHGSSGFGTLIRGLELDKIHLDSFLLARKNGCLVAAPPGGQRQEKSCC